jgi:hypothetical protein
MSPGFFQFLGWGATLMTVSSYFFRNQRTLRIVQTVAALVWMSYGLGIGARPIVAANVLVAGVAAWSVLRGPGRTERA